MRLASQIDGGLDRLADVLGEKSFASDAWQTIINALVIGETRFLRQRTWFGQVEGVALAPIVARKALAGRKQLRVWCAGCSSGEEPYTIAMLLRELGVDRETWDIDILATDLRHDAIAAAKAGEYDAPQLRELNDDRVAKFFQPAGRGRYAIAQVLRDLVRFEIGNLAEVEAGNRHYDGAPPYDLIICRNVLMYMVPDAQRRIAARLCGALSEEGWIAVSPAESTADWFQPLAPVNAGDAILFSTKSAAADRKMAPRVAPIAPAPIAVDAAARPDEPPPIAANQPVVPTPDLALVRSVADAGRLREAEMLCRQALKADDLNGEALILLAVILVELGDFAGAFDSARRAVYLMPSSAAALNLLAGALLKLGHTERARRTFAAAERLAEETAASASGRELAPAAEPQYQEVNHADCH
jgi:chemotaxis protein methyltransferase CheR